MVGNNPSPTEPKQSFKFSARDRLKNGREIARVKSQGNKLYSKHFLLLVSPSKTDRARLAVAITTKIDKRATVRNRIKRLIKEVFRLRKNQIRKPLDILIVARHGVQDCSFEDYNREIFGTLATRGYLTKDKWQKEK